MQVGYVSFFLDAVRAIRPSILVASDEFCLRGSRVVEELYAFLRYSKHSFKALFKGASLARVFRPVHH